MESEKEVFFRCPYCGERVSMIVDELYGDQSYIEDCEVCCNPIQLSYTVEGGRVAGLNVARAQ